MNIFKKEYWKSALTEFADLRKLAFAALICAVTVALDGLLRIPLVPGQLEIKLTFFIIALGCSVYGPVYAVLMAVVVDTLSFFLFPTGFAYFPGYMLTEIVVSLFYCLFLYKRKITVTRIFMAKLCANATHVVLNSLWSAVLMGKAYLYYFWSGLLKNAILLPIEVIIMAALFAAVIPVFTKAKLLPAHNEADLRKLQFNISVFPVLALSFLLGGVCSLYYAAFRAKVAWTFELLAGFLLAGALAIVVIGVILNRKQKGKQKSPERKKQEKI